MNWMPVLPIVLVVIFWAIVFVSCFVSFTRMLRQPTEPEMEAALEHASTEESTKVTTH